MTSNARRIQNELRMFREDPPVNCSGGPSNNDIYHWECSVIGPKNSLYEGKVYTILVEFPADYPFKPPICELVTPIYHPNLMIGNLKIEILDRWLPVLTVSKVLQLILDLLIQPDTENYICDQEALQKMTESEEEFKKKIQEAE